MSRLQNPAFHRRAHGAFLIFWTAMLPVAILSSLKTNVPFLVAISIWALWLVHFVGWSLGEHREHTRQHHAHVLAHLRALGERHGIDPDDI